MTKFGFQSGLPWFWIPPCFQILQDLLVGLFCIGAFLVVQAMFGFPIKDLFRGNISDEERR